MVGPSPLAFPSPIHHLSASLRPICGDEAGDTTKPEGLGMGLAICRSLIATHHGRLWAVNNPDGGVTVAFTLPVETRRASHEGLCQSAGA